MYTYLVKTKNIDDTKIKQIMNKRKVWKPFDPAKDDNPDFIYADTSSKYDPSLLQYHTKLKSIVDVISDKQSISNKYNLYENMMRIVQNKEYLLNKAHINLYKIYRKSDYLENYKKLFIKHEVLIFKPIYGMGGGKGIKIFNTWEAFNNFCRKTISKHKHDYRTLNYKEYQQMGGKKKFDYEIDWVLEEYIKNPLLVDNKKFHLRCFYFYHRTKRGKRGFLFHKAGLFSAKQDFKNEDYYNSNIHDSHYIKDGKVINFPDDFYSMFGDKMTNSMLDQVIDIHRYIHQIINAPCYQESDNCFHVFGSDIMFDRNYVAKLIEVNDKPGYPEPVHYPYEIFSSIMDNIVDYHFRPKFKSSKSKSKNFSAYNLSKNKNKSKKSSKSSKSSHSSNSSNSSDSSHIKTKKRTYLIKTLPSTLVEKEIRQTFQKRGNWEKYDENSFKKNEQPDYLHIDHSFTSDTSLWKYKPIIKNKVDETKKNITNKYLMYINLDKIPEAHKYLLKQHYIVLKDILTNKIKLSQYKPLFKNKTAWVMKIVGGWGGHHVYFLNDYEDFEKICKQTMNRNKSKIMELEQDRGQNFINNYVKNEWILQKYVENPSLFNGRKNHLRVYYLYHKDHNNVIKGYVFKIANILTAKLPYINDYFNNNDIHDTHRSTTDNPYFFPEDFQKQFGKVKTTKVWNQIKNLFKYVSQCINSDCFEESKYCYEVFGADVIVTDKIEIKLLEINSATGFPFFLNDNSGYIQKIFDSSISTVVDKYIPPSNPNYVPVNEFVEVYSSNN